VKFSELKKAVAIIGIALFVVVLSGCSGGDQDQEPGEGDQAVEEGLESAAGGETCASCHTDKKKLVADLDADPPQEVEKSEESEGEG